MSYQQALKALTSQEKLKIELGLDRIEKILSLFGNPQNTLKAIHIAGTNGKGSTAVMTASILHEAGFKVGLFTSPHLVDYTERIKINLKDIEKQKFAELLFEVIKKAKENDIYLTEFEILTVMMFLYFEREKVDFGVLEVGLGGRLDATNVIKKPLVSVITSISRDHTDRLGETIEKIATEKAGIIKQGCNVVVSAGNKGIGVIKKIAEEVGVKLCSVNSKCFHFISPCHPELDSGSNQFNKKTLNPINSSLPLKDVQMLNQVQHDSILLNDFQQENLALCLKSIELLDLNINENTINTALSKVQWKGRFQLIKDKNIILDSAHNEGAAKALRKALDDKFPQHKKVWIFASLARKDFRSMTKNLFHPDDIVILTKFNSEECICPYFLSRNISLNRFYIINNVKNSINFFMQNFTKDYICTITGSLRIVGSAIDVLDI